ncbi:MAG TPA: hypothetical protein ENG63_09715 [Candidatus Desulfofervidus auxilii]|uniref:Uncharacterized protein n=1 Tax=Desulfofervidus auxilii TaxID=1621989 RepID=A0A7C0Y5L0_DESA2|nr:hypothetical protein [Candidatus Desulfofervidus auxilii]
MIKKNDLKDLLLCEILDCGYRDVERFIELLNNYINKRYTIKGKKRFIGEENLDFIGDYLKEIADAKNVLDVNNLYYCLFNEIIQKLSEIYNVNLADYDNSYYNYLDSHLWIDFDKLEKENPHLTKKDIKELKKIIADYE